MSVDRVRVSSFTSRVWFTSIAEVAQKTAHQARRLLPIAADTETAMTAISAPAVRASGILKISRSTCSADPGDSQDWLIGIIMASPAIAALTHAAEVSTATAAIARR